MSLDELRKMLLYFQTRGNETNRVEELKELQELTRIVTRDIRLKTMNPCAPKEDDDLDKLANR